MSIHSLLAVTCLLLEALAPVATCNMLHHRSPLTNTSFASCSNLQRSFPTQVLLPGTENYTIENESE